MKIERLQLISQGAIEDLAYHYQVKVDDKVIFSDSGNKESGGKVVFDRKDISGNKIVAGACYMKEQYKSFDECAKKYFQQIARMAKSNKFALKIAQSPLFEWAKHCTSKVGLSGFHDSVALKQFANNLNEMTDEMQERTAKTIGLFLPEIDDLKCDGSFERLTTTGLTLKASCNERLNTTTKAASPDIAKCYEKDAFVNTFSSELDSFDVKKPKSCASGTFYSFVLLVVSSTVLLMI